MNNSSTKEKTVKQNRKRKQPAKMRLVKTSLTVVMDTSDCCLCVSPSSLGAADDDSAALSPGGDVDVLLLLL